MNVLRKLNAVGFLIYPHGNKYILKKIVIVTNSNEMADMVFDTFEHALDHAMTLVDKWEKEPRKFLFSAVIRYNRGLGVEYKNLPVIYATSIQEAKVQAHEEALKALDDKAFIKEIRVRPIIVKK